MIINILNHGNNLRK